MGALVLCLALLVGACASGSSISEDPQVVSGSSGDSDQATDAPEAGSSESDDSPSQVEQGATSMAASSPIGAFFSDDGGFEAAIAEYTVRVEEAIVVCMAEQGFEFARSDNNTNNEIADRQNDLTAREWTTEYGFGISTSFDSIAQNQASNPNAEILFSLSEAERELWVSTLSGGDLGDITDGGGQGDDAPPLEEQGCIGQALIETGGQDAIEGLQEFGEIYQEGEEALFERREMVDAISAWSRCMSEAGFADYGSLDDPEDEIAEKFNTVIAPMDAALDQLTEEEGQALISGESLDIADLPDLDVSALRELQAEEIELALVDLDCYELEVQATYEPLRDDFENGLITDYGDTLDAMKNLGS